MFSIEFTPNNVFAGIMRLGWFNVTAEENKGYFFGLPVTFAALIFPAFHLVAQFAHLSVRDYVYQILYAVIGIAFICNFRFKKPGLKFSIVMVLAAIAVIGIILKNNPNRMARINAWLGKEVEIGVQVSKSASDNAAYQAKQSLGE